MRNKKIIIFYTSAGGGHYIPAKALQEALRLQKPEWDIQLVNPYEKCLSAMDWIKKITGIGSEHIYNRFILQRHHYFLAYLALKSIMIMRHCQSKKIVNALMQFIQQENPSLVISCLPFINSEIASALLTRQTNCPFIIYPTDFNEFHSNSWFNAYNAYYLCSTSALYQAAKKAGMTRVDQLPGVILRPGFELHSLIEKQRYKKLICLKPIVFIQFGAYGSYKTLTLMKALMKSARYHVIVATGYNKTLYEKLKNIYKDNIDISLLPYTQDIAHYVKAADVMIGKPGANSVAEAIAALTPLIFFAPRNFMPQEKYIAEWCVQQRIACVCKNIKAVLLVLAEKSLCFDQWQSQCLNLMYSGLESAAIKVINMGDHE